MPPTTSVPSPLTAPRATGGTGKYSFRTVELAAGASTQKGGFVSCWATGYYGPAGQSGSPSTETPPLGRFYETVSNATGANGAITANVQFFGERSLMLFDQDATNPVAVTDRERLCSLTDDHSACAPGTILSTGVTAADAGVVVDFEPQGSGGGSASTGVWLERLFPASSEFANDEPIPPALLLPGAYTARAVWTSLAAYAGTTDAAGARVLTASAVGALAAQDGVTIAIGDVLLLPEGTTNIGAASDAGFWQVTGLGAAGAKWSVQRAPWWTTGEAIPLGQDLVVGGEGTLFAGSTWRAYCAKGQLIDTGTPLLYPDEVTQQVTLVTGGGNVAVTNVPIRSATKSNVVPVYAGAGTPAATTLSYAPGAITPGPLGTATVTVQAVKAAMAAVTGDTSVVNVTIVN
jgi:hypothetical protein